MKLRKKKEGEERIGDAKDQFIAKRSKTRSW